MILLYTNEKLVRGFMEGREPCVKYIYREYFPMVRSIVSARNGNLEDAEDIFHDGLIIVHNRLKNNKFTLNSTLKTYLYSVCKNLWKRRLERKYRLLYAADTYISETDICDTEESQEEESSEKFRLYKKNFAQMPEFCRELLTHYILKTPLEEIARIMNYKDAEYVKARKYYCKNLLRKKILNDPECKQFMNYE
ncbi:MAG: sigma-70 family RNA polymerase sigma factor [Bacteroidetes bacterium]|nr:sigma-70 family RNA polymerase sigma factor [Bacteroidota bacterium]